jgi:hypothetical protein
MIETVFRMKNSIASEMTSRVMKAKKPPFKIREMARAEKNDVPNQI